MNRLYPVFIKLAGRPCLVVGGGEVGRQKVEGLLAAGAAVTVVSPHLEPGLLALCREGRIRWTARPYVRGDLEGMFLAFAAVDDPRVSAEVFREAEERRILFNAVDHDPHCIFHVPATVARGDLKVAISTAGKSPALAAELRERLTAVIGALIDDRLARFAAALGELRPRVLARYAGDPDRRKRILVALARSLRPFSLEPPALAGPALERPRAAEPGKVYLVGAGPGDPGLLTLRGAELIASAQEVHHDRLVGPGILARIPPATPRVFVGKEVGSTDRPDTGELLVRAARDGKSVVRLKGGDPHIFGRGGEEMLALLRAGVPFEVVPGVSALNAAPAAAGIPLTYRGLAHEVVVRSGYRGEDPEAPRKDRPPLRDGTTYVYFMTIGRLSEIVEELLAEGLDPSTPAALVQRGTLPDQRVLTAPLGALASRVAREGLKPPAMLIAGEVVRFANWKDLSPVLLALEPGGIAEEHEPWKET